MTLLAGRSITKSFGSRLILDAADLSVEPQARIGVIGPNGSGKSTLLKILAGLETPDGGGVSRGPDRYLLEEIVTQSRSTAASRRRTALLGVARAPGSSGRLNRR